MNKRRGIGAVAALILVLASGAGAQNVGRISGAVYDLEGKPWPDVTVEIKNTTTNQTYTVMTDQKGQYMQIGLSSGVFTINFKKDQVNYAKQVQLGMGQSTEQVVDFNLKEVVEKNPEYQAALKKQEEAKKQFGVMKAHFDSGVTAINEAQQIRSSLASASVDQKSALQQKMAQLYQTAITEFQQAEQMANPQEPNLALIVGNLGAAYEAAGKYEDAAASFQKAVELKPTEAKYYLALATNVTHVGKMPEATAACEKFATLEPSSASVCWRNMGAVLYNENKLNQAVEPLRKAAEVDPKNPDIWYLLGAALLNTMGSKMEGGKLVAIAQPGTAEAYQKYLELAPNGPHAAEARAALDTLKSLGAGVQATVETRKKK